MKRQSIPMSHEEYETLEKPFGWKVEYWNGQAQFTPREFGVTTHLDLSRPLPSLQSAHCLVSVEPGYQTQMVAGYYETFVDSVEFCGWSEAEIQASAEKCMRQYFSGRKGEPLPASVIALEPESQNLAGLALFVLKQPESQIEFKPHLALLYVRPSFQRRGVATAMVSWGVNRLLEADFRELFSAYHVCNHTSRQWHHRFGFADVFDAYYIRMRYGWLRHEIWRREKLGVLEGLAALTQERDQWQARLDPDEWY